MVHEVFRHIPFPFRDSRFPDTLGAVIQRTVLDGDEPARQVIHTSDNSWMVGDGVSDPNIDGATIVAAIVHVAAADPAVADLATLACGYVAERDGPGSPWRISAHVWPDDPAAVHRTN